METPETYTTLHAEPVQPQAVTSPEINELAKALCSLQGNLTLAAQDRKNPFYNSSYATLGQLWEIAREPMSKAGLALTQLPSAATETVTVETILMHTSGQYIRSAVTMLLRPEYAKDGRELKPSPQQVGSAITYARRYAMSAVLGLAVDQDDDGNAASAVDEPEPKLAKNRQSAYTGETLDTKAAHARHKAAVKETPKPGTQKPTRAKEEPAKGTTDQTAFNARLYDACKQEGISPEQLAEYLRGRGILTGKMTIDNLAEKVVSQLLDGKNKAGKSNWEIVVGKIRKA